MLADLFDRGVTNLRSAVLGKVSKIQRQSNHEISMVTTGSSFVKYYCDLL